MKKGPIEKKIDQLVRQASFVLRDDVLRLIKKARRTESNKRARQALDWIIENAAIAKASRLALCQDTGLPVVFLEAGKGVAVSAGMIEAVKRAVEDSYRRNRLRASFVDPLARGSSGFRGAEVTVEFDPKRKGLRVTLFPKGFGSENKSRLAMLNPTASLDDIEAFVIDSVRRAGPEACPPFVVGVGIGGTSDQALLLAKKALCRRIDKPNPDRSLRSLEKRLVKRINALKIGAMGFGGKTTALRVAVKKHPTHIAGLPVGVNISCWALRSASVKLTSYEFNEL